MQSNLIAPTLGKNPTAVMANTSNKKIAGFLGGAGQKTFGRQDSGFNDRASEEYSGRYHDNTRKGANMAAPNALDDYGFPSAANRTRDYGARKRMPMSAADKKDKVIELERENNALKEKENFLHQEIKMMKTKLLRVEGLIKKRARANTDDDCTYDISDMHADLNSECDDVKEQNTQMKENIRKAKVVLKGLTSAVSTGTLHKAGIAKNDKYAHVQGKLDITHSKVTKRYAEEAKDMRAQIAINQRKEMTLEKELKEAIARNGGQMGDDQVEQIRTEILDMSRRLREFEAETERMQGDFTRNETIFKESKNYVGDIQDKIRKAHQENEQIRQENFRLELEVREVSDIHGQLEDTIQEREDIERSIRNITERTFTREDDGNTIAVRIADLQQRLQKKDQLAKKLKEDETRMVSHLKERDTLKEQLTGETNQIEGTHKAIQDEYQEKQQNRAGPTEQDAVHGLLKMDAAKYTNLMTDLAMGVAPQNAAPIWANLPFLEQQQENPADNDPKKTIKNEIERLRQEKSDFAAELEKAQNLLRLQTDIERENTIYYSHEEKRLKLIEKSAIMKVEEMSKRADDKARSLNDLERKATQTLQQTGGGALTRASIQTDVDARSEFSAQTQESEIGMDENILDFKVEDAEFDAQAIAQVPSVLMSVDEINKQFITVVTVDFYNHSTETTQMSEGLRANYQTQFSFVNKVDSFYTNFLQKNSIKMDVYVSKNNAAVQVGRAEILMKELIESEIVTESINAKTPVIQKWARVFPISFPVNKSASGVMNEAMRPLGVIKFKMRLRKPIQQAMRFYREMNEIKNVEKFTSMDPKLGSVKPQKKLITITIVGAKDLKMRYANVSNVSPFFFYQFYTFDDRYSSNAIGTNPQFNDTYSYETLVDAKAIQYFERESLDIILFDDNAPIAGVSLDQNQGAESDDMIGMCKVPLATLATGCSIHERMPIKAVGTNSEVGTLEVRIDIMNLENVGQENLWSKLSHDLVYSKQFEKEVVMQIARKLAPLNCEIELMFGIFSQGQRNCTQEDFKHTCLQRLRLQRDGMSERELDIFFNSHEQLRDSNVVEKDDFVYVFSQAIAAARNERLNQISYDQTLAQDAGQRQTQSIKKDDRNITMQTIQEQEIYEILGQTISQGYMYQIREKASANATLNQIKGNALNMILCQHGIHEQDARKVVNYLEINYEVDLTRLEQVFQRAKKILATKSQAIEALDKAFQNHGRLLVQQIEQADYNKDGQLNIDGFQAALRIGEVGMSNRDLEEAFWLSCGIDQNWAYQNWIKEYYPHLTKFFSGAIITDRASTIHESTSHIDLAAPTEMSHIVTQQQPAENNVKYLSAKQKIEQYIIQQDLNIGMMFALIDTNSDSEISYPEFRQKMRAMHLTLDEDELKAIFNKLDVNNDHAINYDEFINEFASMNTEKIVEKMKKILTQSKIDPEYYFEKHCVLDRTKQKLTNAEFTNLLQGLIQNLIKREIYHLRNYFDRGNKNMVTRQDFLHVISSEFVERKVFNLSIEDVIKPLATKIRKHGANVGEIFGKIDKNRNGRVSAEELGSALKRIGIKVLTDDIIVIKDYFRAKTQHDEVNKTEFIALMNKEYERKFDKRAAELSLSDIRKKCQEKGMDNQRLQEEILKFNEQRSEQIYLAGFKRAIHKLKCMDQYAIDNLAKFLDTNNEGYISIASFIAQTNNASLSSSFKAGKTNKWAK